MKKLFTVVLSAALFTTVSIAVANAQSAPAAQDASQAVHTKQCSNPTDTLLDYTDTGEPICKPAPTGCPYGDSIPLGAECDKFAPQAPPAQTSQPAQDLTTTGWGK